MARHHKRSKATIVQVNPNAYLNYVMGILTGARDYITGLLEGASLYNAWVQQEMSLEGKPLQPYAEDKETNVYDYLTSPNGRPILNKLLSGEPLSQAELEELYKMSNYERVLQVDKYMKEAGKAYREMYPQLLKSKNAQAGLAFLQNYQPEEVTYNLPDIVKSKIKLE